MKRRLFMLGMAVAFVAGLSSCATANPRYVTDRKTDTPEAAFVIPPTAKVSVGKRISERYTFEGQKLQDIKASAGLGKGTSLKDELIKTAVNDILIKNGADILIAPLYNVQSEYKGNRWAVEITGYLGTYVDWDKNAAQEYYFRPATEKK